MSFDIERRGGLGASSRITRRQLLIGSAAALGSTSVFLAACSPGAPTTASPAATAAAVPAATPTSQSGGVLKLGFMSMMTGAEANYGEAMSAAANLAVEKLNSGGGVEVGGKRYTVSVVTGDEETRQTTERAVGATLRLIQQEKVLGIVGFVSSSSVLAAIPVAQQNQVPVLDTVGNSGNIADTIAKNKMDYIFQVCPTSQDLVEAHGQLLASLVKPKKIFFVLLNSDAPRDYERRAKETWPSKMSGLEMQSAYVEPDRLDLQPEILKIRQFNPDVLYVQLSGANVYAFADQLFAAGLSKKMAVLGASDYGDPVFPQKTGAKTDLNLANVITFKAPITDLTEPFFDAYTEKMKAGPPYFAVQTYDGMLLMFEGIRRAGAITGDLARDRASVKAGLEKITEQQPMKGVRGPNYFLPLDQGHKVKSPVAVVQFQAGKSVLVWPQVAGAGSFIDPRSR